MSALVIDGKKVADEIKQQLKQQIAVYTTERGSRPPHLAVVLVGDDPAGQIYVGHKEKACQAVGIKSETLRLAASIPQETLITEIQRLNRSSEVDGILLQLPLPKPLDKDQALDQISSEKDVDGLTPLNQGLLVCGREGLFSCTPLGCMELIRSTRVKIQGSKAVVIGRSLLVGSPLRTMLIHAGATVTTVHTKTEDPRSIACQADILIAAAGVPHLVKADWIKAGAVVIDVGMHRDGQKLIGDVDFESVKETAGFITPVPGGVGPMTIAMLLKNCVTAYCRKMGLKPV